MYHVVICKEEYRAPFQTRTSVVFEKGEVYQAEQDGEGYKVWRNKNSFFNFSPTRFERFFRIFC